MKQVNECTLLAVDTSTKSTGFAVFVNGKLQDYDCLELKKIENTEKRIQKMINEIFGLMQEYKPDIVVTEMTVVVRNAQAQRNLTMILGAIYGYCIQNDIFYYSFRPTEWRKLVSDEKKPRKREELKLWSKHKAMELFGIPKVNDDISDAILVGQAYINKFKSD